MNVNDLWLVKDVDGYWRVGYEINSINTKSRFFNPYMPSFTGIHTALLFKYNNGVHGMFNYVDEETAVRYGDLGEEE